MGLALGAYLKKPVTVKISDDENNDKLKIGASSMQGWRVSQQDAHNCLLDFDTNTSLFGVYDGHGGHEVAEYCAQKLPQYIKDTEAYKEDNLKKALIDAFLGFDATITTPEVIEDLKLIARAPIRDSDNSDIEENVSNLCEEATMPLEEVIQKYAANFNSPCLQKLNKDKIGKLLEEASSSISKQISNKDEQEKVDCTVTSSSNSANANENSELSSTSDVTKDNAAKGAEAQSNLADSSLSSSDDKNKVTTNTEIESTPKKSDVDIKAHDVQQNQNGELSLSSPKKESPNNSESPQENGEVTKKGKASKKTKGIPIIPAAAVNTRPKRNIQQLYNKLLEFQSDSESEDEEDKTFEGPIEMSSSDEDSKVVGIDGDNSDTSEEDDEDLDEEEDIEEESDDGEEDISREVCEHPGYDSGCTAVVALLRANQLFVANAGDSRCIVCRNGKAVEMSIDHKPEDAEELDRIVKAGGYVSGEGRVDGGLNLSRAIGDHVYKQNKDLTDREQMITALPDVRTLTINPKEDEFMVLACDGIWNFMSSQQVVDFVKTRLQESPEKISQICEEMFDHCLAPDTFGDGTGCDNMTAIIVQFKDNLCKRSPSSDLEDSENQKRIKTDETVSQSNVVA